MQRPDDLPDKASLRRHFRDRRRVIDAQQRAVFDQCIRQHLAQAMATRPLREVSAFMAFDGEPDLAPLLQQWHAAGTRLVLPVVPADRERGLSLLRWEPGAGMSSNHLGIREPQTGAQRQLADLDLLLMPLVAYDEQGNRLGMGAGYYDRLLASSTSSECPLRVGVAYACQRAEQLPRDAWDIPLHAVVTEDGWFTIAA
jgi:5-formyltetrahydrofolate cyclo-ligase